MGVDAGDAEIIESFYVALRRFAAVAAPWDMDPDDVLHSVLVRVLSRKPLMSLDDPPAYLRRSILNHINSEMRSRGARRSAMQRIGTPDRGMDHYPSDLADLSQLLPVDRAILYLHDVEGFGFEEVAGLVGMNAGRVRMRASRARSRLRDLLIEETER